MSAFTLDFSCKSHTSLLSIVAPTCSVNFVNFFFIASTSLLSRLSIIAFSRCRLSTSESIASSARCELFWNDSRIKRNLDI